MKSKPMICIEEDFVPKATKHDGRPTDYARNRKKGKKPDFDKYSWSGKLIRPAAMDRYIRGDEA